MKWTNAIMIGALTTMIACSKNSNNPNYPVEPYLEYKGMNTNQIHYNDSASWLMYFDFRDGDGDLGTSQGDSVLAINIKNLTTGFEYLYPFPFIPPEDREEKDYIEGSGVIKLQGNVFFLPRQDSIHNEKDTFSFEVFVTDNAGHKSNVITSDTVYISP